MVPTIFEKIVARSDVVDFLSSMRKILHDKHALYIVEKFSKEDKTAAFRSKYGLTHDMVVEELLKLDCTNYCYQDNDDNSKFNGEVWIFGQYLLPPLVDKPVLVYIKLKLKSKVVCLSFHEAEYEMHFPYNQ